MSLITLNNYRLFFFIKLCNCIEDFIYIQQLCAIIYNKMQYTTELQLHITVISNKVGHMISRCAQVCHKTSA